VNSVTFEDGAVSLSCHCNNEEFLCSVYLHIKLQLWFAGL